MVSHPGQILMVDGWCPILVMAPKIARGMGTISGNVYLVYFSVPQSGAAKDPGHGTKIARGFVRYKGEKGNFNSSHLYRCV